MVKRADFNLVDNRPPKGTWFEDKVDNIHRGEGKFIEVPLVVLCQTFDKGNTITEKIAKEEDFAAFPQEYAEFLADKKINEALEESPAKGLKKLLKGK